MRMLSYFVAFVIGVAITSFLCSLYCEMSRAGRAMQTWGEPIVLSDREVRSQINDPVFWCSTGIGA